MSEITVDTWCDKNLIVNDERRDVLKACWKASYIAAVEKLLESDSIKMLMKTLCYYHNGKLDMLCINAILDRFKKNIRELAYEMCSEDSSDEEE